MNNQSKGIVVNQIDYKDNDAIIKVITEDYGLISLYVKGYKKITSKNVYATQLFDLSEFMFDYTDNGKVQILKSASLINEYATIKSDYDKTVIASMFAEIVNQLSEELDYNFVQQSFDLLSSSNKPYLILNLFLAEILKICGVNPNVDGCSNCGNQNGITTISVNDGGFICEQCNSMLHYKTIGVDMLRNFRIINKADYSVIDKILNLKLDDFEITKILMSFMIEYLGLNLKSYSSLESIN